MEKFISMMTTDVRASEDKTNVSAGEDKTDVSAGEKESDFVYPPSIQGDLCNYRKPGQQEILKPILRIVKRPYQVELCISLLDYLEGFGIQPMSNPLLDLMQKSIIKSCDLHPLRASLNN